MSLLARTIADLLDVGCVYLVDSAGQITVVSMQQYTEMSIEALRGYTATARSTVAQALAFERRARS